MVTIFLTFSLAKGTALFKSSHFLNTAELLVLNSGRVSAVPGCHCCPGIDEALEAIGEISHAENMEYSSDAHSSQPATASHRPY